MLRRGARFLGTNFWLLDLAITPPLGDLKNFNPAATQGDGRGHQTDYSSSSTSSGFSSSLSTPAIRQSCETPSGARSLRSAIKSFETRRFARRSSSGTGLDGSFAA